VTSTAAAITSAHRGANRLIVGIVLASAALFTSLSGLNGDFVRLSDLFLGRTDNISTRFAAAVALLFNVIMVLIAIIAIAMTVPKDDPRTHPN
jgi:DHA2 family multidrug resistance protein-like MFS transporter